MDDGIDILVDLAGHTRDSRIEILGARLAPVQITYLGYPNTSGLDNVDYRISDPYADTDSGTRYSEKLLRLPESFLCFGEFENVPRRTASPAADDGGRITFGSFNNIRKINQQFVKLWSEILHAVPGSRLVLKSRRAAESITVRNLCAMFESYGVDSDRIEFTPPTATRFDHLNLYNSIDIALDTFPYHGTTTTCEALWMGVPVITLVGEVHAQRVSYSILKNLGLDELITYSADDYVNLATSVSHNREHLDQLRTEIPKRLSSSILCDVDRFVDQFEQALLACLDECQ